MGYAVELLLDRQGAERIRKVYERSGLELSRIPHVPHLSLAVFDEIDSAELIERVQDFAEKLNSLEISLSSIGMFPNRSKAVFLAARADFELLDLHHQFHHLISDISAHCLSHYRPGSWVPHCTIGMDKRLPKALDAIAHIHEEALTGEYRVDRISVIEFPPPVAIATFKLSEE